MKKLLSVTLFSGLLTLLRMGSGFLIAKVVAIYTGPGGVAMLGQLGSFVTAINGIVTAPAGNGLVKYTAEYQAQGFAACSPWWRASTIWMRRLLIVTMAITLLAAYPISIWLFSDAKYSWLIVVTALVLPLSALNTLLGSAINGQHQYRRYIVLGMVSVVVASGVTLALITTRQLEGALLSAGVFSAMCGCIMIAGCWRQPWFKYAYWFGATGKTELDGIRSYLAMAMTSALCAALTLIMTRKILIDHVGLVQAGYWQAVFKISEVYLGVITMALATYYYPRLAAAVSAKDVFTEIFTTARVIVPIATLCAAVIYVLRDLAITLLFTEEFRPARELFALQLVADVVKILSWMLAYAMIARKSTTWFIATEVCFSASFPALVWLFVRKFGVDGANLAYLVNYVLYLVFLLVFARKYIR